jgi:magnesium-transporting ATPase (P-type)
MTYQEKKSIVSLISAILIFVSYCLYLYPQYPEGGLETTETFRFWGSFVLILTLVSIVAHIIISIIFNIVFRITTREKEPRFADELDKLIDLKANRNSFFVFIVGFLLAMGSLIIYQPSQVMFIILITSGFISDVTGSVTKLYHYRKGV